MNVVFFGSSNFAVPILEALHKNEEVALVVTQPDREKGRDLKISPTPIKICADKLGIKLFQPEDVNSSKTIEYLRGFNADLFIVVSFGEILSEGLLSLPKYYSLNIHASLLPKYRGAAPINWAITNGEKETGVTIIKMNEGMDEGDIVLKENISINDKDDAISLSEKLSKKGSELLLDALRMIKEDKVDFIKQDNIKATYAPKLKKENGVIDWNKSGEEIYNRIRAFVPWPGCFTYWDNKVLKVWKALAIEDFFDTASKPATVLKVDKSGILVKAGKGLIKITELQLEGKRRMSAADFIAGHKEIVPGIIFCLRS